LPKHRVQIFLINTQSLAAFTLVGWNTRIDINRPKVNSASETGDVGETRGAQHVGRGEASATVMTVDNHAAIQIVVELCLQLIESRFEFLKRQQSRMLKPTDIPLWLRPHIEN
jgi:hypothetical protein